MKIFSGCVVFCNSFIYIVQGFNQAESVSDTNREFTRLRFYVFRISVERERERERDFENIFSFCNIFIYIVHRSGIQSI